MLAACSPVESEIVPFAAIVATPAPIVLPAGVEEGRVVRVVDGDTIHVEVAGVRSTIRLIGIDTPETVDPRVEVACFGPEASAAAKELLDGETVYLEKDVSNVDRYGRLLRYVYLDTGVMVNEQLVKDGYAISSTYPPDVKHQQLFIAAQRSAREANLGLWGGCSQ